MYKYRSHLSTSITRELLIFFFTAKYINSQLATNSVNCTMSNYNRAITIGIQYIHIILLMFMFQVAELRLKVQKYEESHHGSSNQSECSSHSEEDNHEFDSSSAKETYTFQAFRVVHSIRKEVLDLKPKISEFVGTEQDKEYVELSDSLMKNLIDLNQVESKGINVIRKRRKEALRVVEKVQEELKKKVLE